eukprot:TRINITY_DN3276_c0_g2_i5.p1 TRINITY_DN3276_c0_g2~~TRINITY_DN3276_c0_g2_i5.p1  ORF type:complete len:200 (+),score=43.49 TRINITY_DN3276_c0_g2_i5:140-739(+)
MDKNPFTQPFGTSTLNRLGSLPAIFSQTDKLPEPAFGKPSALFPSSNPAPNPFLNNSGGLFDSEGSKDKKAEEKQPFGTQGNLLFGAGGLKGDVEEKKVPLAAKDGKGLIFGESQNPPEEKKAPRQNIAEHIKQMTFEEFKSLGMSGKTMSEIFNKWRSKLIGTANEMKETEKELQDYEGQLLDPVSYTHLTLPTICSV